MLRTNGKRLNTTTITYITISLSNIFIFSFRKLGIGKLASLLPRLTKYGINFLIIIEIGSLITESIEQKQ